jgi:ParB family chromosome partitioning protein
VSADDTRRRGLGRGLSALFADEADAPAKSLRSVPIELLHPGRFQPRRNFDEESMESLVESVRAQGILQPILVRRSPDNLNTFEILAGERRWRAAQRAKLHEVPIVLREMGDREAMEIALVENIQREDLTAIEEARAYLRLIEEFNHTQEALAQAVGKSRSHITNTLRLMNLPEEVRAMIEDGSLSAGHARALVTARDALHLAREVLRRGLSVRQIEAMVKAEHAAAAPVLRLVRPKVAPKDADIRALEQELTQLLGLKVEVEFDGKGGTLTVAYRTLDQLDEVLAKLRAAPKAK